MFDGKTDHIVLYCNDILSVRNFYENILRLKPKTILENYITYELGFFLLCFKEKKSHIIYGEAIAHIGVEFPTRLAVDEHFSKIKKSNYLNAPSNIIGGPGLGPYRFYIKDPSGYTLEFESWDGCSD